MDDLEELNVSDNENVLTQEEREDLEAADETVIPITYSGQDFDVDGLVRRLDNGDMIIPRFGLSDRTVEVDGFQREFVWSKRQMDRFIETLLLEYPVPGIFLVKQQSDKRLLVLDGQQRLLTLQSFKKGVYNKRVFELKNVCEQFRGLSYEKLSDAQRRAFDNAFIQATVVNMDENPESREAVYQIFERLNSGGTQLTAHEIRVAIFTGSLVQELSKLNDNEHWRSIYGPKNRRLRDHELILRIIALYLNAQKYAAPLKSFLNRFMSENRGSGENIRAAEKMFEWSVERMDNDCLIRVLKSNNPRVSTAVMESFIVSVMHLHKAGRDCSVDTLFSAAEKLMSSETYVNLCAESTTNEGKVRARLQEAWNVINDYSSQS